MAQRTDAELDEELEWLEKECKKRFPFTYDFFEDRIEDMPDSVMFGPFSEHPKLLAAQEHILWMESATVCHTLRAWKNNVADIMGMRSQLMNGFTTSEQTASDTLDTLTNLCFGQRGQDNPSATDAWDATAFYAAKLVSDNGHEESPIHGMEQKGELAWCYEVMIRLIIVAYTDTVKTKEGYFEKLLGGPPLEKMSRKFFKRNMFRIDNKPLWKENEMDGIVSSIAHEWRCRTRDC